jgi:hypothetical protein
MNEWLVCESCRQHRFKEPCFKLWGPLKQMKMSPSRPPATPDEAVISPDEVLLLQYIYSDTILVESETVITAHLIRKLACFFGPSIPKASLRNAVLAYAYIYLPSIQSNDPVFMYLSRAHNSLNRLDPVGFDEMDLYSAFLLAVVYAGSKWMYKFNEKSAIYLRLFISILTHLNQDGSEKTLPTSMFWSITCRRLYRTVQRLLEFPPDVLPLHFSDTPRQFLELQNTGPLQDEYRELFRNTKFHYDYTHIALCEHFSFCCTLLSAAVLSALGARSDVLEGSDISDAFRLTLSEITSYLHSREVQEAVKSYECQINGGDEGFWGVVLLYRCSRFLSVLLTSRTIIDGLESREGLFAGRAYMEATKSVFRRKSGTFFTNYDMCRILFLSALRLSVGSYEEG